ncbi:MAG: hypothetical protein IT516_07770 [Burkholderiales bacterium]|nr:hypothetical protein [Burkholderiales bacterium]
MSVARTLITAALTAFLSSTPAAGMAPPRGDAVAALVVEPTARPHPHGARRPPSNALRLPRAVDDPLVYTRGHTLAPALPASAPRPVASAFRACGPSLKDTLLLGVAALALCAAAVGGSVIEHVHAPIVVAAAQRYAQTLRWPDPATTSPKAEVSAARAATPAVHTAR